MGENVWLCDPRVNIEDLNEMISTTFPTEEFDTLGGFVFDLFGKIPAKYEKVSWNDFDFIVQDMEGHKVNVIKVIRRVTPE
jgi:CBS domain containing-hemolysin-like protein